MKHVVLDARIIDLSTGRYTAGLLEGMLRQKLDFKLTVLAPTKSVNIHRLISEGLLKKDQFEACDIPLFSKAEQVTLPKIITKLQPDLTHFTYQQMPFLFSKPFIVTVHDLTQLSNTRSVENRFVYSFKQRLLYSGIKRAVKKAEKIIVPSNYVKNQLERTLKLNSSSVVVTYEAATELTKVKPVPLPNLHNSKFILYVGNAHDHKNLYRLVEAYGILQTKFPALRLVLSGKTNAFYKNLQSYCHTKGYIGVVFTDFVSDQELLWLYERCKAYVFPSLSEGFGLSGLEALAAGAPVISSSATCLPEIYGDAAFYFDPTNVDDMANKIEQVLNNETLSSELRLLGPKQASKYSWKKMASETLAVYEKVIFKQ